MKVILVVFLVGLVCGVLLGGVGVGTPCNSIADPSGSCEASASLSPWPPGYQVQQAQGDVGP